MMKINKNEFLIACDGGLTFYEFVLGPLTTETTTRMKNVHNPFYTDNKASVSIYIEQDRWWFYDHGDTDFKGDVFDFASLYYDIAIDKFPQLMEKMILDLALTLEGVIIKDSPVVNVKSDFYQDDFTFVPTISEGCNLAHHYFDKFGISIDHLREYNVSAINSYTVMKGGKAKIVSAKNNELWIGYHDYNYTKIYCPAPKKFWYVGTKTRDTVFGWRQIIKRNSKRCPPKENLFITGGEKDVLTLTSLGFDAISLNSETSSLPIWVMDEIVPSYDNVIVLYDSDSTGQKKSQELAKAYGFLHCKLPEKLLELGGKDISDYVRLGFNVEDFNRLIADTVSIGKSQPVLMNEQDDHPTLPRELYSALPQYFRSICNHFETDRDKDLLLLSTLVVLSTCFPKVRGLYSNESIGMNLYLFISAPAASGKGNAKWSLALLQSIVKKLQEEYDNDNRIYKSELLDFERNKKKDSSLEMPKPPLEKILHIPANSSSARLIEILRDNDDVGLIFETEADTLTNVQKNDWGNISDMLRKAFHHEAISAARKNVKGTILANSPHLSILLTGTPKQIEHLIETVENGFFSRFLYYYFDQPLVWKDPFKNRKDFNKIFLEYSKTLYQWWEEVGSFKGQIHVTVDADQQKRLAAFFSRELTRLTEINGRDIAANVIRMGICNFRICMVLTIIRNLEGNTLQEELEVSETDFDVAFQISQTLFLHLETVFNNIKKTKKLPDLSPQLIELYSILPDEFDRSHYDELAVGSGIKKSTADKYLTRYCEVGFVERVAHGRYKKGDQSIVKQI